MHLPSDRHQLQAPAGGFVVGVGVGVTATHLLFWQTFGVGQSASLKHSGAGVEVGQGLQQVKPDWQVPVPVHSPFKLQGSGEQYWFEVDVQVATGVDVGLGVGVDVGRGVEVGGLGVDVGGWGRQSSLIRHSSNSGLQGGGFAATQIPWGSHFL